MENNESSANRLLWKQFHDRKQESLAWFREARFGMFIHWRLYSLIGGVYQGKRMEEGRSPRVAEWIMHAFDIPPGGIPGAGLHLLGRKI